MKLTDLNQTVCICTEAQPGLSVATFRNRYAAVLTEVCQLRTADAVALGACGFRQALDLHRAWLVEVLAAVDVAMRSVDELIAQAKE